MLKLLSPKRIPNAGKEERGLKPYSNSHKK